MNGRYISFTELAVDYERLKKLVVEYKNKIDAMELVLAKMETIFEKMYYMPGAPGYIEARSEFESHK
jgi:hypothetical protein